MELTRPEFPHDVEDALKAKADNCPRQIAKKRKLKDQSQGIASDEKTAESRLVKHLMR